jgi:hypothetical protein
MQFFFKKFLFVVEWPNSNFGPWTLHSESTLSLNFQIGQFNLQTFISGSNPSLCWYGALY